MEKKKYIVVDGNIGAGKSTLLSSLSAEGVSVVQEPIDQWCSRFEHRGAYVDAPLQLFYRDPTKYALPFQLHVINTRIQQLMKAESGSTNSDVFVMERDPFDTEVFVEDNYASGAFDVFEHRSFTDLTETMRQCIPIEHVGNVYLRLDPEICMKRIKERGREAESCLSMTKLQDLHRLHEQKYSAVIADPKSIVIDARLPANAIVRITKEFVRSFDCK